jgi:hypothetical protein
MRLLLPVALVALIAAGSSFAQTLPPDRPDFSGVWVLDEDNSAAPKDMRRSINVVDWQNTLIVGRSGKDREVVYSIHERPSPGRWRRYARSPGAPELMSRSWWDGAAVITEMATKDGVIVATEKRYMEGAQMVVVETAPGDRRQVSYWTKLAEIDYWKKR